MRILMVSVHFDISGDSIPIGGVQKHISKITDEFRKRNNIIEWAYPGKAKEYIENFKPDLIIAHDFCSFVKDTNIPQIVVFHGWEGSIPLNPEVIKVRQEIEKKASASICVGDYISKWYGQKPDLVIYGGVKEVLVVEPPRDRKLLLLGRLAKDSSPQIFFQALSLMQEKYSMDVCGDGPLRAELEQYVKDNNLDVTFHGFVNNVDEFIKKADIVLTSGYLSILEAYINKRPVLSVYDNPLKEDYLYSMPIRVNRLDSHTVQISCFDDINRIASHLDYTLLNGYLSEAIENNYQFALQNTWIKLVDKYEELIKKIL
jgi:hypothetical protein